MKEVLEFLVQLLGAVGLCLLMVVLVVGTGYICYMIIDGARREKRKMDLQEKHDTAYRKTVADIKQRSKIKPPPPSPPRGPAGG